MLMIGRCVLTAIDDSTKAQTVQAKILHDEVRDDVERFQQFGFTSVPDPSAGTIEGVVVFVGGNRAHPIVIATEDRTNRPKNLSAGESALYTAGGGLRVYCRSDGEVHLGTTPTDFVALASLVDARISAIQAKLDAHIVLYNAHVHTATGCKGAAHASSDTPLGAQATVTAAEVKAK